MILLSTVAPALAWTHPTTNPASIPEPPRATFVVPGASPELWMVGSSDTIRLDPRNGAEIDRRAGRWSGAADVGGRRIWCGEAGIVGPDGPLVTEVCTGIAPVDGGLVATTVTGIWRWTSLTAPPERDETPLSPTPHLVTDGRFAAAVAADGTTVVEWDKNESRIATGGTVTSLASGPRGWTWLLASRQAGDVTRRALPLHERPIAIARASLDGDGSRDLLVVHEGGLGMLGADSTIERYRDAAGTSGKSFGSGGRSTWSAPPVTLLDAVPMDVDADGCDEIVALTASTVTVWASDLCDGSPSRDNGTLALPQPMDENGDPDAMIVPPEDDAVVDVGSLQLGHFVGRTDEDYPALSSEVGAGWAFAGSLANANLLLPTFPALSAGIAWGGRTVRASFGIDTAGLLLWTIDSDQIGIHFAMVTAGLELGDEALSIGPFVTGGLWAYGAGLRALVLPSFMDDRRAGIEVRMTWFHPGIGEVLVLYTSRGRLDGGEGTPIPLPKAPKLACHRFGVSLGVAAGAGSTANSWEFVGQSSEYAISASPAVSGQCGLGEGPIRGFAGVATAPFYKYFLPFQGQSEPVHHLASATFGVEIGSDVVHGGPIADVGLFMASAGVRAAVTPIRDRRGVRHGADLRFSALLPALPGFEAMLMYTAWYDPVAVSR